MEIHLGLCDSFVMGGADVRGLLDQAAVAGEARLPFWVSSCGYGATTIGCGIWQAYASRLHCQEKLPITSGNEMLEIA